MRYTNLRYDYGLMDRRIGMLNLGTFKIIKVEQQEVTSSYERVVYKSGYMTTIWLVEVEECEDDINLIIVNGSQSRSTRVFDRSCKRQEDSEGRDYGVSTINLFFDGLNDKYGFKIGDRFVWQLKGLDSEAKKDVDIMRVEQGDINNADGHACGYNCGHANHARGKS